jgi:uncharacterized protein (TIGR00725 family)
VTAAVAPVTIGVMGSGDDPHETLAAEVGRLLARLGVNLLTGGGGGVMASVSRAFTEAPRARGICIGVLPCASAQERARPKPGYPNPHVELAIRTHLPLSGTRGTEDLSRNHINVLSCAAVVALPGGAGTASEVALALRYGTPVIVYAPDPRLAQALPAAAPRAAALADVERFLAAHLAGA